MVVIDKQRTLEVYLIKFLIYSLGTQSVAAIGRRGVDD